MLPIDQNVNTEKAPKITEMVNQFGDQLYNWACKQLKDESVAKDMVQETFISAFRNFDKFNGLSSPKTWLFAILKNKAIDYYRAQSKMRIVILEEENDIQDFDDDGRWKKEHGPKDWIAVDENLLDNPEFERILTICLSALPGSWASCIHMKYLSEDENEIICQQLNISTSNLWQILHRAKLQLRRCLEKNWFN